MAAVAAAKSLQSCPTLCDPIDGSPTGPAVPGILQARTLEWVASSFSNAGKWKVEVKSFSCVWLLVTPWTAAYQAPPSMGFSRQEYWSGVPLPSPMTNLDSILKRRDITLPTKVHLVKDMVFPVVMYGCKRHDWTTSLSLFTFMHWRRNWQPTPVFLPGESQGRGSLVGFSLWCCTESDTTEAT